mmetsp:Transcript_9534/g.24751  ORF Transcript_9534/g.24751 Transcript_9534/m.24751 type:complete len:219 (-) Transcript_9534:563-1219(-)
MLASLAVCPTPKLLLETKGLLFFDKPAGLSFHANEDEGDPGLMPLLRSMQSRGDLDFGGRIYAVHRLDRVTSGLMMIAKSEEAAREAGRLLRERTLHKYYVALSGRKPSKKMGRVTGDMARSRRGSWKLLRSTDRPAVTTFVSESLAGVLIAGGDDAPTQTTSTVPALRAFALKPLTGRTHQVRSLRKGPRPPQPPEAVGAVCRQILLADSCLLTLAC